MADLAGKVAIITGSSSGIGAAVAILFASKRCSVSICGRNAETLAEVKRKCGAAGLKENQILINIGDVTCDQFLESIVKNTIEKLGKIDILVNNAGVYPTAPESKEIFDLVIKTNLRSAYVLSRLCIPHLTETKGKIVNVSSSLSSTPMANGASYGISKAGMDHMTKCMALELAKHGIRVNAVNPGYTDTNIVRESEKKKFLDDLLPKVTPVGRIGNPEEMAQFVYYLVSDDSSYVTGSKFIMDGGVSINYNWGF